MVALITQTQWEAAVGADAVAALTGGDADVITEMLALGSDEVQEYASAAGVVLTSGTITPAMRRRVAICCTYFASVRAQQNRSAAGKVPYTEEYGVVTRQLEAWANRTRPKSDDTPSTAPEVLSDDPRGW